jgi:hypothetical protein
VRRNHEQTVSRYRSFIHYPNYFRRSYHSR